MKALHIDPTEDTPRVALNPDKGDCLLEGNSYPENSAQFYQQIIEWMETFIQEHPHKDLHLTFNFDYFNTSSAKYILELLRQVQRHKQNGNNCVVDWFYFEEDTDMQEAGEDYQQTLDLDFRLNLREDTL